MTTEKTAKLIESHLSKEIYFKSLKWFNSYYELSYLIPIYYKIEVPQYAHVMSIKIIEGNFILKISIYEPSDYDLSILIKYQLLNLSK